MTSTTENSTASVAPSMNASVASSMTAFTTASVTGSTVSLMPSDSIVTQTNASIANVTPDDTFKSSITTTTSLPKDLGPSPGAGPRPDPIGDSQLPSNDKSKVPEPAEPALSRGFWILLLVCVTICAAIVTGFAIFGYNILSDELT